MALFSFDRIGTREFPVCNIALNVGAIVLGSRSPADLSISKEEAGIEHECFIENKGLLINWRCGVGLRVVESVVNFSASRVGHGEGYFEFSTIDHAAGEKILCPNDHPAIDALHGHFYGDDQSVCPLATCILDGFIFGVVVWVIWAPSPLRAVNDILCPTVGHADATHLPHHTTGSEYFVCPRQHGAVAFVHIPIGFFIPRNSDGCPSLLLVLVRYGVRVPNHRNDVVFQPRIVGEIFVGDREFAILLEHVCHPLHVDDINFVPVAHRLRIISNRVASLIDFRPWPGSRTVVGFVASDAEVGSAFENAAHLGDHGVETEVKFLARHIHDPGAIKKIAIRSSHRLVMARRF